MDHADPPQDLFAVDLAQILQFMLFTAIVAAPNYIFQTVLEKCFPTRTVPKSRLEQAQGKDRANDEDLLRKYGQLDVGNTVIKFFLGPVIERNDEHDAVHRRTGPDQGTELRVYSRSAFQGEQRMFVQAQWKTNRMVGLLANVAGRLQVLASGMLAEPCHGADGV